MTERQQPDRLVDRHDGKIQIGRHRSRDAKLSTLGRRQPPKPEERRPSRLAIRSWRAE